jgi:hypothetical protein
LIQKYYLVYGLNNLKRNKMKYKLINTKTKEETLCDKVTIEGFDYYVSDELPRNEDYGFTKLNTITEIGYGFEYKLYRTVIATTNPHLDIPKVADEVEILAEKCNEETQSSRMKRVWKAGYNKSQETHPFSEQDMIEFSSFRFNCSIDSSGRFLNKNGEELLQLWKEQKPKTLYYE